MNVFAGLILALAFALGANAQSKVTTGEVYKIISATNHTVLDVTHNTAYNGNPIIPYPWKTKETGNQLWVAEEVAENVYIFVSTLNRDYALDASLKINGELIIHKKHGDYNQRWRLEPIKPNAFTFYIKSVYDGRVIELDANKKGVSLKWKDADNLNQRWVFAEKV